MRISDWSSDVCSSDLLLHQNRGRHRADAPLHPVPVGQSGRSRGGGPCGHADDPADAGRTAGTGRGGQLRGHRDRRAGNMKIGGTHYRSISVADNGWSVRIMDQRKLPWAVEWVELTSAEMAATAISEMWTRGAPLIGATAAYGLCMALRADASDASPGASHDRLLATRPTAINLKWALDRMVEAVQIGRAHV